MGIGLIWQNSVWIALQDIGVKATLIVHDKYELIFCNEALVLNLIPLNNDYDPLELVELQEAYQLNHITLVQLWEDVWHTRQPQVLGRIKSVLGLNKRLHARKGVITDINQKQADDFLNDNHIQRSAKSKYKFALVIDGQTVAVACFSYIRFMKRISPDYKSVELIRFATLKGFTVTGGFTKLLKHFTNMIRPDDVMSYADRDWSLGNAYELAGFKLVAVTPPAQIWLEKEGRVRFFPHRLPICHTAFIPVFNTGNLKYTLYLK